jgi:hypothetical protein
MVVKFRNTTWPPPPQLSLHRRAALSSNSNGTRSYIHRKKDFLKIQEYTHEGANLKLYIPEFFNFKLYIPEYSPI